MVFISVVPDNFYFLWQIEIQLHNFKKFGISRDMIHILIGADSKYGLSLWFKEFVTCNEHNATFYIYPFSAGQFCYSPSIRPHLLKQHFSALPHLSDEVIFYHDSDIIFRVMPDFEKLSASDTWYVADTRSYLDSGYVKSAGEEVFQGMCSILKIDPSLVESNDSNAGGAQYVLKNIDAGFWESMEGDCERLYAYLTGQGSSIQSWCTDMWVLFWNGLKSNRTIRISEELNFSWAGDPIANYEKYKIYHNTGISNTIDQTIYKVFNKTKFGSYPPYFERHNDYSKEFCAYEFVKLIADFEQSIPKDDLSDLSFLIPVYIDSEDRLVNLEMVTKYIYKHFNTKIIVAEAGTVAKVDLGKLPPIVEYHFFEEDNRYFHHAKYNNLLVGLCNTKFIAIYDTDVIFPPSQILDSMDALRSGLAYISYPYCGDFLSVEGWIKDLFRRSLDHRTLTRFKEYCPFCSKRSYGGCVILDRATFIENGGDNERFTSWGPEDIERPARYKILGFDIHRSSGALFHLPHKRGINCGYQEDTYFGLMTEYLNICSYTRNELKNYIRTWDYVRV